MANGLFMSPAQVRAAENQLRARQAQLQDPLAGAFFNLGNALGGGAVQLFGGDPRSPAEIRAGELQALAADTDFSSGQSVMDTANRLNEAGFTNEAFQFLQAIPKTVVPPKRVVDEFVREETVGDTTKRFIFQRDNFGFLTKAGEVSDTFSADSNLFQFSSKFLSDVNFDEDIRSSVLNRLANRPEFTSTLPGGGTDVEELAPFTGLIQKVANDLKASHRDTIGQAFLNGNINRQQAELAEGLSDDFYINEAFKRFIAGGGVEANIDRDFIGGADVELSGVLDTTDPNTLQQNIDQGNAKAQAVADVAARTGNLVVGNPKTGEFRLGNITPETAAQVFSRLDNKTDGQIVEELAAQGFSFTPEMLESHAARWQLMRENPVFTATLINLSDTPDLRDSRATELINEFEASNNFPRFASASAIFAYLRRLQRPQRPEPEFTERELFEDVAG